MEKQANGMMAVFAALVSNILVAISKFVGYALSGKLARPGLLVLAESVYKQL